jgi:hypothetical protein
MAALVTPFRNQPVSHCLLRSLRMGTVAAHADAIRVSDDDGNDAAIAAAAA